MSAAIGMNVSVIPSSDEEVMELLQRLAGIVTRQDLYEYPQLEVVSVTAIECSANPRRFVWDLGRAIRVMQETNGFVEICEDLFLGNALEEWVKSNIWRCVSQGLVRRGYVLRRLVRQGAYYGVAVDGGPTACAAYEQPLTENESLSDGDYVAAPRTPPRLARVIAKPSDGTDVYAYNFTGE